MENDDSRTRAKDHSGRINGPSCEGATEQPSPPTPPPTSPLSTSGNPAKLSATRRKLQRHGRICRTQKFRRLTRGASPIFRPDAPLSIATITRHERSSHLVGFGLRVYFPVELEKEFVLAAKDGGRGVAGLLLGASPVKMPTP